MKLSATGLNLFLTLLIAGCVSQPTITVDEEPQAPNPLGLMVEGYRLLSEQQPDQAITYFDQAIDLCQGQLQADTGKIYAVRSQAEAMYYLLGASAAGTDAMTVDTTCPDALFLKAYAMIDLDRMDEAESLLKSALEFAPVNARYLSELGHIYQSRGDWDRALGSFSAAEDSAQRFSPESVKQAELSRAKRGMGYNLIELGRLNEAETKFRECLEINPDDETASNELIYIEDIRIRMKNGE